MSYRFSFGELAPELQDRGFQPIPVRGKAPVVADWTTPRPAASWLPRYAEFGVGLLAAATPAVDIDVRHPDIADELHRGVEKYLGEAPVRFGNAPKRLLLYRAEQPFAKLATAKYRLPGDPEGDKGHAVEILGAGQQFVAFGVHPDTGRNYAWPDDSPLDLERDDLPELTVEIAGKIVAACDRILHRHGTPISSRSLTARRPAHQRQPGPAPRRARGEFEADQVLTALRSVDPSGLDYDGWVSFAYAIKAAFGDAGERLWCVWSGRSWKNVPATTLKVWSSIAPDRCGWRYASTLAAGLGARP